MKRDIRLNSLGKQSVNPWLLEILACPVCKSDVRLEDEKLKCINDRCELKFPIINGIPIMLPPRLSGNLKLTREKWNEEYQKFYPLEKIDLQHDLELRDAYIHVKKYMKSVSGLFLEVGCGRSKLSCMLAKERIKTIGIDVSLTALKIGKELFERENTNGLFVCGDIRILPFKDNSFSFMYAGGVIEHFKDTRKAVNELFRCLTPNGFITATVPCISLSTPYRIMRWGNIPDIFPIDLLIESIEKKILQGKFMRFGYEKSFTPWKLRRIFETAGFSNVEIGLFKTYYPLEPIRYDFLKRILTIIANTRPFWPMIYVNGLK